jgi:uncharacterized protein (TIGR02099 family)
MMVMLAIYVSVGRLIAANVASFRTEILQELNARVPLYIEARQVSGQWQSFTPVIVFTGLRLTFPDSSDPPLELSEGRVDVDVLNSIRTGSLQLSHVALTDLSLRGELSREGKFHLTGFGGGPGESTEQLQSFLLNVELITLRNNQLDLTMPGGEVRDFGLDLLLSRDGSVRRLDAELSSTSGTQISVLAEGVGDPFSPELFAGQAYLNIQSTDLGALKEMLRERQPIFWADGAVNLELWIDWDKGRSSVEARLEGRDLLIAAQEASWRVPMDRVAFQANLQQRDDQWTLFVSDLELEKSGVAFTLPRLQLDVWGSAARIRASDISLQPISAMVIDMEVVPEELHEVFARLQPRGRLSLLQVSTGDIDQLTDDWKIEANFEKVDVDSYHGAPGLTATTGYLDVAPGGGFVVLDSQVMTLTFPEVYHEPLHFEDLQGTVHLDWNTDTFRIASGLLTTQGEEGIAKVLFGLNIPLQASDVGIEMDLLVGLQGMHPTHRAKFIPFVLNPSLLTWLDESIGDGLIEQGAFLWRGSLKKNSTALHTVQLAFNVTDTQLTYHPQWPPVQVEKGVVLIDDSDVSVWADRASLFESTVEQLSVETRLNAQGQIMLSLNGRIFGPAADGFRVLHESPIAGLVGPTFTGWTVAGDLETDVALNINLSDHSTTPQVDVTTRWRNVDLMVVPGNLPVHAVNGEFTYSTSDGFSSRELVGELWGEAIEANLMQHSGGRKRYDPASSMLDIELAAKVGMADVRHWLQLEPLAFVAGKTSANVTIRLASGKAPVLTVDTDLLGVSLDLPEPWRKTKDEVRRLHIEMPMTQGGMPLSLDLGEDLRFQLDIAEGRVRGGGLGISVEPPALESGVLRVVGNASLIQGDEWLAFVTRYFPSDESTSPRGNNTSAPTQTETVSSTSPPTSVADLQKTPPLEIRLDAIRTDTLVALDRSLQDATLSLVLEGDQWSVSLDTDWLRGDLFADGDGGASRVEIEYLNLDGLSSFDLGADSTVDTDTDTDTDTGESAWDLPKVDVTVKNIFKSDKRLGELAFELAGQDGVYTVKAIIGELAKLRLHPERPGKLVWHQGEKNFTELQVDLSFEDIGSTLEYFGYQRIVETKSGNFVLDLRWPGAPRNFSLRDGQGSVQVAIGQGSFLEVPAGAAGAVRVVSILDLVDIVQRLSLSQMFESGIPFDSVNGEIYLHEGTLEIARMDVEGSSSFQFSGVSDVENQSLTGELIATLPVASNLPWIAALAAASLPVAAGVFVVSKVFNSQMNRLSSAVYRVGGTWRDPEVTFDHIFDIGTGGVDAVPDTATNVNTDSAEKGRVAAEDFHPAAESESP